MWNDNRAAQRILRERASLEDLVARFEKVVRDFEDAGVCLDLAEEAGDASVAQEATTLAVEVDRKLSAMEFDRLLSGPEDRSNCLVSINAGAGGADSQDWSEILLRLYLRYCERRGWATEVVDQQAGEEAGLRSVTFTVEGAYAYGYLKVEAGVHRLVRISPFDGQSRRQTAFAAVFVIPELDESITVDIQDDDLRIDTFRAGGKGGQHVNKTESAVRITHIPTGLAVSCQNERSQHKNKSTAMRILKARLHERERLAREKKIEETYHSDKKDIGFGSQIRSYVLHPYRMVKDHRTDIERGDVDRILDGDIAGFVEAELLRRAETRRP